MAVQLKLFEPLKDFQERLPNAPYCGQDKMIRYILPKEEARNFPYIQINFPLINYLCFDCDFWGAEIRPLEMDIPGPTLTVITPETGHAHLMYELLYPIAGRRRKATRALLNSVIDGYKEMLCADRCITTQKQLVKNPLSSKWRVLLGYKPFTLTELAECIPYGVIKPNVPHVPDEPVRAKEFKKTLNAYSRNCSLFENGRFYAYSVVHKHNSYDSLYHAVFEWIEHLNDVEIPRYFPTGVGFGELHGIAKSVASWTFQHRGQFRHVNKRAMGLPSMRGVYWQPEDYQSEVKRRRSLSAQRTNEGRKETTKRRIQEAIQLCRKYGYDPTVENIRTASRLGQKTVYRYKEFIQEIIQENV